MYTKIKVIFRWYDLWIGLFIDRKNNAVYFFPVPCIGFKFSKYTKLGRKLTKKSWTPFPYIMFWDYYIDGKFYSRMKQTTNLVSYESNLSTTEFDDKGNLTDLGKEFKFLGYL